MTLPYRVILRRSRRISRTGHPYRNPLSVSSFAAPS